MIGGSAIGHQMKRNPAKVTGKFPAGEVRVTPAFPFCAAPGVPCRRLHSFFMAPTVNRPLPNSIAG
jgi:hypothetical protein